MVSPSPSSEALYFDAIEELAEGRTAEAIALFHRALETEPGLLDAMHGLIRALRDQGELDQALTIAQRLIALDPDDPLAYTSLSILYQQKGMIAEAEAAALKAKLSDWKRQLQEEGK